MATKKSSSSKRSEAEITAAASGESVGIPEVGAAKRTRRAVNGTATTKSAKAVVAKPAKNTRNKEITATVPQVAPVQTSPAAALSDRQVQDLDLARYQEEVARLAYHLWEQRGYAHGYHEEDWYRAQEQIRRRYTEADVRSMAATAASK